MPKVGNGLGNSVAIRRAVSASGPKSIRDEFESFRKQSTTDDVRSEFEEFKKTLPR